MTGAATKEYLAKCAERVGASTFFFDPIVNMTREELLGLVGWMQDEMQRLACIEQAAKQLEAHPAEGYREAIRALFNALHKDR